MNQDDKKLAEQLLANSLFNRMLEKIEQEAVETLVYADTEQSRIEAQWKVTAARAFRQDCQRMVDSKPRRKGGVA